jgi:hypothetical protein
LKLILLITSFVSIPIVSSGVRSVFSGRGVSLDRTIERLSLRNGPFWIPGAKVPPGSLKNSSCFPVSAVHFGIIDLLITVRDGTGVLPSFSGILTCLEFFSPSTAREIGHRWRSNPRRSRPSHDPTPYQAPSSVTESAISAHNPAPEEAAF